MPTAADTVWNCTELLELILSFVPTPSLLTAQRTCRRWRAVISWSTTLQRCLFLKPDRRGHDVFALNPLLMQRFRYLRDPKGYLHIHVRDDDADAAGEKGRLLRCATASWRRMLVAQPPEPFTLSLCVVARRDEPADWYSCAFGDETTCGQAWSVVVRPRSDSLAERPQEAADGGGGEEEVEADLIVHTRSRVS